MPAKKSVPYHSLNDRIVRPAELIARYGISRVTLHRWIRLRKIPKPHPLVKGGRGVGWYASELEAFEAQQAAA